MIIIFLTVDEMEVMFWLVRMILITMSPTLDNNLSVSILCERHPEAKQTCTLKSTFKKREKDVVTC